MNGTKILDVVHENTFKKMLLRAFSRQYASKPQSLLRGMYRIDFGRSQMTYLVYVLLVALFIITLSFYIICWHLL